MAKTKPVELEGLLLGFDYASFTPARMIELLNSAMLGRKLQIVKFDTAMPDHMLGSGNNALHAGSRVHVSHQGTDRECISIPVRGWINLSTRPIAFDGLEYWCTVDFGGNQIKIRQPYFFYPDHSRVDYYHYLIFIGDPIDS